MACCPVLAHSTEAQSFSRAARPLSLSLTQSLEHLIFTTFANQLRFAGPDLTPENFEVGLRKGVPTAIGEGREFFSPDDSQNWLRFVGPH